MKDSGWKIYETQIQHIMILQAQTTFELFIKCSNKMKRFFLEMSVFTMVTQYFISNLPGTQQNLGIDYMEI